MINKDLPHITWHNLEDHMVFVAKSTFQMGSENGMERERPIHAVKLENYYISRYAVTQSLWQSVMNENPSNFPHPHRPVEDVSYEDCERFLKALNQLQDLYRYRLPSEAEWEYAARGGKYSKGNVYAGSPKLNEVGWYSENYLGDNRFNSEDLSRLSGLKRPNELGLYDMSGNVWEWCHDWYAKDYYKDLAAGNSPAINPKGPSDGTDRVVRGGSWYDHDNFCRVAYRDDDLPDFRDFNVGFRLCRYESRR